MNRIYNRIYLSNSVYHGARLLVGAVGVVYLTKQGITPSDISIIKLFQLLIFLLSEIPISIAMSIYGRRKLLLGSSILGAFGALGFLLSKSLPFFIISESLVALSLTVWPTAMINYSMLFLDKEKERRNVDVFFHKADAITKIVICICGLIGGFLFAKSIYYPYAFFCLFYILNTFYIYLFLDDDSTQVKDNGLKHSYGFLKESFNILIERRSLWVPLFIFFCSQIFLQPLYHYWQLLFIEKNPKIEANELSYIFTVYTLFSAFVSFFYSKLINKMNVNLVCSSILLMMASLIQFYCLSIVNNIVSLVLSFSVSFSLFQITVTSATAEFQKKLTTKERPVMTGLSNIITRIGTLVSLSTIGLITTKNKSIVFLFSNFGSCASLLACFFLGIMILSLYRLLEKKKMNAVTDYFVL